MTSEMVLFCVTAGALTAASAFDGWTTVRFVKLGYEEKTTRWLLGPSPSWKVVYLRGGIAIALELAIALALVRFAIGWAVCGALLAQAVMHIYEGLRNLRLK